MMLVLDRPLDRSTNPVIVCPSAELREPGSASLLPTRL